MMLMQTPECMRAKFYLRKALLGMMHGCFCLHACACCADRNLSSMLGSQNLTTIVLSMVARHMGHSFVFSMMLLAQPWHAHCTDIHRVPSLISPNLSGMDCQRWSPFG